MQVDGREETARRARRVLLGFRIAFYSVALVAGLAVLAKRASGDAARPLVGKTSQGAQFSMGVDRDGRAWRFDAEFVVTCPNGSTWTIRWWPQADAIAFHQRGKRLRVVGAETFYWKRNDLVQRAYELVAEVGDDSANGRMSFVERYDPAVGDPYECLSGPVRFAAKR